MDSARNWQALEPDARAAAQARAGALTTHEHLPCLQELAERARVTTTHSQHDLPRFPNLLTGRAITGPHQVWVADITYLRLGLRFIYLAVILDAYTRAVRGWHLSTTLDTATLTSQALRKALAHHPAPAIHHSDQGAQYATPAYRALLPATTQISMAAAGQPT